MSLKYTSQHEWIANHDGLATVGITHHAQDALGDVVFVELPEVGARFAQGDVTGVVESVKAAADVYAPVSGTVTEVNGDLDSSPENINSDPYGAWMFKMKPDNAADVDALLDAAGYQAVVDSEAH